MKTLTVAELRYLLAQLPPELDDKPVGCNVLEELDSFDFTAVGVTRGNDRVIINLD